jgi:hypothetical protein
MLADRSAGLLSTRAERDGRGFLHPPEATFYAFPNISRSAPAPGTWPSTWSRAQVASFEVFGENGRATCAVLCRQRGESAGGIVPHQGRLGGVARVGQERHPVPLRPEAAIRAAPPAGRSSPDLHRLEAPSRPERLPLLLFQAEAKPASPRLITTSGSSGLHRSHPTCPSPSPA